MSNNWCEIESYDTDVIDVNLEVSLHSVYVNEIEVDINNMEVGTIWDYDGFLDYCKSEGFDVTEADVDGKKEIIIKTGLAYEDGAAKKI
jgi:hypothetical protein